MKHAHERLKVFKLASTRQILLTAAALSARIGMAMAHYLATPLRKRVSIKACAAWT
jgi:hypothetical protein